MPDQAAHQAQVAHNLAFLRSFQREHDRYSDWVITVAFYTALHLIDAYAASMSYHPTDQTTCLIWTSSELKSNRCCPSGDLEHLCLQQSKPSL